MNHVGYWRPDGQCCVSRERVVLLSHHPLLGVGASARIPDHLTARLGSALLRLAETAGDYDFHPPASVNVRTPVGVPKAMIIYPQTVALGHAARAV